MWSMLVSDLVNSVASSSPGTPIRLGSSSCGSKHGEAQRKLWRQLVPKCCRDGAHGNCFWTERWLGSLSRGNFSGQRQSQSQQQDGVRNLTRQLSGWLCRLRPCENPRSERVGVP